MNNLSPIANDNHRDFYVRLRRRVQDRAGGSEGKGSRWLEFLLAAPDLFHLLCKLVADARVPVREKGILAAAILYFISPVDFLPELVLGSAGFLDDVAVAACAIRKILQSVDAAVLRAHWAGEGDVLEVTARIIELADESLGSGLWRRIKKLMDSEPKGH